MGRNIVVEHTKAISQIQLSSIHTEFQAPAKTRSPFSASDTTFPPAMRVAITIPQLISY